MAEPIPTRARELVTQRDQSRCVRCRVQVASGARAWHHRRSRSVKDDHQHCPCNGITLCHTCHAWVHAHPLDARRNGWVVARSEPAPWAVPVKAEADHWMNLDCYGGARHATAGSMTEATNLFKHDWQ